MIFNGLALVGSPHDRGVVAYADNRGLLVVDSEPDEARFAPGQTWYTVTWSPAPGVIYLTTSYFNLHDP